jgi:hypothetical protein
MRIKIDIKIKKKTILKLKGEIENNNIYFNKVEKKKKSK